MSKKPSQPLKTKNPVGTVVDKLRFNRFLRILGPGLVTGAADDDPSGIATYSQTGAQYGLGLVWTALYQLPLLVAIQEACARIGAVTGKGLAGVVKENYSKKILFSVVMLVVVANAINIGADIGAIGASVQLIFPDWHLGSIIFGSVLLILLLEIFVSYRVYARILKFLSLSLLAYVITAFLVPQPWGEIFKSTLVPHIELNFEFLFLVVGVFGTTITPYMFFWQASGVVEEEKEQHVRSRGGRPVLTRRFIKNMRIDNFVGMLFSNLSQWFIMITAATVLFSNGVTNIETAADAAKALEPLVQSFPNAGEVAKLIFAVGIIGIGLQAIPVLAGSSAYALSEAFGWKGGLSKKFGKARGFYVIIILSMLAGLGMNFVGINPIKALIFTAVFNGVAAVPLLFLIARINGNANILGKYKGGIISRLVIWIAFLVMTLAVLALFYSFITGQF